MMTTKVILQLMVYVLVFTILMTHQAWGEDDCYDEKDKVKHDCMKTLDISKDWEEPSHKCRRTVQKSDMACICRIITIEEQIKISMGKLVRLARECGKIIPDESKCGRKYQILLSLFEINCHA